MINETPTVLIVEDSKNILELLELMVEFEGWNSKSLTNLVDFMVNVQNFCPDVILMDMLLSGSNGCDACREIKANDSLREIPVIMMSAHPQAHKESKEAGADYFIDKPFEMEDMIAVIKKSLSVNS